MNRSTVVGEEPNPKCFFLCLQLTSLIVSFILTHQVNSIEKQLAITIRAWMTLKARIDLFNLVEYVLNLRS